MGSSGLYVWGNHAYGKLGVGEVSAELKPTKLPFSFPARCVNIASSGRTSGALTEDGQLFMWGDVCKGTMGVLVHTPARVLFPPRTMVQACALGRGHVMALAASGQLFTW